ncbi:MAG: hemerythrin domain-containing protein [Treponema sp.]
MEAKTYSVQVMVTEHTNIIRFAQVVRAACIRIMNTGMVSEDDFYGFIGFARNYSDKYHHGKEEKFLFNQMAAHLGEAGKNLVHAGMLVEHDLCRRHILDIETALAAYHTAPSDNSRLDIIEAAAGYANLISRHIEKENSVVYPFAERCLAADVLKTVDAQVSNFEAAAENAQIRETLLKQLYDWQAKYGISEAA